MYEHKSCFYGAASCKNIKATALKTNRKMSLTQHRERKKEDTIALNGIYRCKAGGNVNQFFLAQVMFLYQHQNYTVCL